MSARTMATARLMETWAHGIDIAEALGIEVRPHDRVRHVCHLGVITRKFAFANRGEPTPSGAVRVELTSPSGKDWAWGPADAPDIVVGSAWDFGLLVTRRRGTSDVDVRASGDGARRWLQIAQAFAGPPGPDPASRQ